MVIAKEHTDKLPELKKRVEDWHKYFKDNIKRYNDFRRFAFKSTMTQNERNTMQEIGKPTLEFNIVESYINKLRGEFAKQQPSLQVRAADGVPLRMLTPLFNEQREVIEAHLRCTFFDSSNDMMEYDIFTDLLTGGFSGMRVFTEYVNEMSFEQKICVERSFDPCLNGFDIMATKSHKGDGRFCFEIYPMSKGQFVDEFGDEALEGIRFLRALEGFEWSYKHDDEDIVLVCDMYEKIAAKKENIIKLSNGHTVREREYKAILNEWDELGIFAQPPVPVGEKRKTIIHTIRRYRFCETRVLDVLETNYKHLPIIFVDGNSIQLAENGQSEQFTRPYIYNAKGVQRLKDFSGNCLANELENLVQHKFIVSKESIPPEYKEAYKNVQKADVLVYNHFYDKNSPEVTLPPPMEVTRTPIPPQITETFRLSDEMTTAILGAYDGNQLERANMSGIAVARNAIQSNAASMPYIVGFTKGLNRAAEIYVDLVPKYFRTPRSLPILKANGKREYVEINNDRNPKSLYMNYDSNCFDIKVEVGTNFAIQKEIALETIIRVMGVSKKFEDFINAYGLQILLDNIEIRGIEEMQEKAVEYEKMLQDQTQQQQQAQAKMEQIAQQQSEMAMLQAQKQLNAPAREQVDLLKVENQSRKDSADLSIKEKEMELKFLQVLSDVRSQGIENALRKAEIQAENARTAVEAQIDVARHIHEINKFNMETKNGKVNSETEKKDS